jgi:DNA-binding NtrC family response regulator
MLIGESGTGKELAAQTIHELSRRRTSAFLPLNCGAVAPQLIESELFGHERGSFTGADRQHKGFFERANGGTIFLDEIGHLPPTLQSKLLRVLQERQIRRVGGTKSVPVDVKVIAATHVNLAEATRRGEFRDDLYYRLNVLPIELPPLRSRQEDIVPLALHFARAFAEEYGVAAPTVLPEAQRVLVQRRWPGNVRELRNTIERAVLLCDGKPIDATAVEAPELAANAENGLPFPAPLAAVIAAAVREMLALCAGNKSEAARRLAISRTRLQRLLESGGEEPEDLSDATPSPDVVRRVAGITTPRVAVSGSQPS